MKSIKTETIEEFVQVVDRRFDKGDELVIQTILKRKDFHEGKFLGIRIEGDDIMVYIQTGERSAAFIYADEILVVQNNTKDLIIDNEESVKVGRVAINIFNAFVAFLLAGGIVFAVTIAAKYLGY